MEKRKFTTCRRNGTEIRLSKIRYLSLSTTPWKHIDRVGICLTTFVDIITLASKQKVYACPPREYIPDGDKNIFRRTSLKRPFNLIQSGTRVNTKLQQGSTKRIAHVLQMNAVDVEYETSCRPVVAAMGRRFQLYCRKQGVNPR